MSVSPLILRQTLRRCTSASRTQWLILPQRSFLSQLHHQAKRPAPSQRQTSILSHPLRRFDSSITTSPPSEQSAEKPERKSWRPAPHRNPDEPVYEMFFTCKPCKHRSAHTISKQGYHKGTVLVKCPSCDARHLISDHLRIFSDEAITVEDLLAQKGESIEKGTVGEDGDVEFWEDKAMPKSATEQ